MADVIAQQGVEGADAAEAAEVAEPAVDAANGTSPASSARNSLSGVGAALRMHRLAKGLSLRQFARQLGVSASFISQLENGKSQPSVATLFAICEALDVTVDQLFAQSAARADRRTPGDAPVDSSSNALVQPTAADTTATAGQSGASVSGPVVRGADRRRLVLDTGVMWEQLSSPQAPGEFLMITYEPGGSSTAESQLSRHSGTDYGMVISGRLTVALGFETFVLDATDSISFDSSIPHRLHNAGDEPVQAIWFVLGAEGSGAHHAAPTGTDAAGASA